MTRPLLKVTATAADKKMPVGFEILTAVVMKYSLLKVHGRLGGIYMAFIFRAEEKRKQEISVKADGKQERLLGCDAVWLF
jgi:hypothetical protein